MPYRFTATPAPPWRPPLLLPTPRPPPSAARVSVARRAPAPRPRLVLVGAKKPPPELVARFRGPMRAVLQTWVDVSHSVPVELTSWWRSPAHNRGTRGATTYSQHLVGTAIDGRSPGLSRAQLLPIVTRAAARYGVTVPPRASEGSGSSVHAQALAVGAVEAMLTRNPTLLAGL